MWDSLPLEPSNKVHPFVRQEHSDTMLESWISTMVWYCHFEHKLSWLYFGLPQKASYLRRKYSSLINPWSSTKLTNVGLTPNNPQHFLANPHSHPQYHQFGYICDFFFLSILNLAHTFLHYGFLPHILWKIVGREVSHWLIKRISWVYKQGIHSIGMGPVGEIKSKAEQYHIIVMFMIPNIISDSFP